MRIYNTGLGAWLFAGLLLPFAPANAATLRAPKVGSVMTWACDGPFTKEYRVSVIGMRDGVVTYRGTRDGEDYEVEKPAALTGTTLWTKQSGDRVQWMDDEDFAGIKDMVPGSHFKGAVPARRGEEKWVWDYRITIEAPQVVKNQVLGRVRVFPLVERRRIYHGDYWSKMTSFVEPKRGITVRWIYEDPRGLEDCTLSNLKHGTGGGAN